MELQINNWNKKENYNIWVYKLIDIGVLLVHTLILGVGWKYFGNEEIK